MAKRKPNREVPETFDVPILTTLAEMVLHFNTWAEASNAQYRIREVGGLRVLEWFDPRTGEVA